MPPDAPEFKTLTGVAAPGSSSLAPGSRWVPPLLPILLPLIVAAIVIACCSPGGCLQWFRRAPPAGALYRYHGQSRGELPADVWRHARQPAANDIGRGVVVFDYNGDGYPDLFFVNGAPWPGKRRRPEGEVGGRCALFRNDGHGHFTDVSHEAGLDVELQGMGRRRATTTTTATWTCLSRVSVGIIFFTTAVMARSRMSR